MASQKLPSVDDDTQVLEINSYIRGYHAYMDTWDPALGQELILKPEPITTKTNTQLQFWKIVGYVPYNLAPRLSQFLRRELNNAFAEVTGEKVNRGAGYGLEIPCVTTFMDPKFTLTRWENCWKTWETLDLYSYAYYYVNFGSIKVVTMGFLVRNLLLCWLALP